MLKLILVFTSNYILIWCWLVEIMLIVSNVLVGGKYVDGLKLYGNSHPLRLLATCDVQSICLRLFNQRIWFILYHKIQINLCSTNFYKIFVVFICSFYMHVKGCYLCLHISSYSLNSFKTRHLSILILYIFRMYFGNNFLVNLRTF